MNLLLIFPGFILAFLIVLLYEYKIRRMRREPRNKVRFFIVRDDTVFNKKEYVLWMGKPVKSKDNKWVYSPKSYVLAVGNCNIIYFGFDPCDFSDMKEDEIREVFINTED